MLPEPTAGRDAGFRSRRKWRWQRRARSAACRAHRCRGRSNQDDLDRRRFGQHQHLVGVEIALHRLAVGKAGTAVQRRRQTIVDAAFDLGPDTVGIDDATAIDRRPDARHADPVRSDGDFGDLGNDAAERFDQRDAAADAGRLAPERPAGLEHGAQHRGVARLVGEHRQPKGARIGASLMRQFIDETFGQEPRKTVADRPPEPQRHRRLLDVMGGQAVRDPQIGNRIGQFHRAFDCRSAGGRL